MCPIFDNNKTYTPMNAELIDFLSRLLTVTFGVLAGGTLGFFLLWPKVEAYVLKWNAINQNRMFTKEMQQMRFAAYERLLLFAHRIEPRQAMLRNHQTGLTAGAFGKTLIQEVEEEYWHNFTQQLYVSDIAWRFVSDLKDNTIRLFRNAGRQMPEDAPADRYVEIVLKHMQEMEENPYEAVQAILKKEMRF